MAQEYRKLPYMSETIGSSDPVLSTLTGHISLEFQAGFVQPCTEILHVSHPRPQSPVFLGFQN